MHFRELFNQPINLIVSVSFVLLIGLVVTSVVLENSGLPNPIAYFGGVMALALLDYVL